jgi:hypothetical protein
MSFIIPDPHQYLGKVIGNGHCVALVQRANVGVPHTSKWQRGIHVKGTQLAVGTVIATFNPQGRYDNKTDGSSHVAILMHAFETLGLEVIDQWVGHPCAHRTIRFKSGSGLPVDDGDAYFVLEAEEVLAAAA